jgi:hypothetical protein
MPFYDDDGNELNPKDFIMPKLCYDCKKNGLAEEKMLCTLIRLGCKNEDEFECRAFEQLNLN